MGRTYDTRTSLLFRVRERDNSRAWEEFVSLYRPMLMRYARARGLSESDAEDVAQHCLSTIAQKISDFNYDPRRGRFRGWLKKMVNDRVTSVLRKRRELSAKIDEFDRAQNTECSPEAAWEKIWLEEHLSHCCERVRERLQSNTYEAFRRVAIDQKAVADVCAALGMTPNQVYVAKSRVTRALQDMMADLYGDE